MRICLYARVSSEKQAEKDLSIPAQLKAMREYATKHGDEVVCEYVDEAQSARTADRPQFQAMIASAKQQHPPFDGILVWKLSRFARNREDSIIYKSLLRRRGIQVVSINEPIEDSPAGKLFEGMIEAIDEFYSANLAQDVRRGMRECAGRGFRTGGSVPTGYKVKVVYDGGVERKALDLDETYAPIVRRMFMEVLGGSGVKEVVTSLNREGLRTRRGRGSGSS